MVPLWRGDGTQGRRTVIAPYKGFNGEIMVFSTVPGGFKLSADDERVVNTQRAITRAVNDKFIQVGAVYLRTSGKMPIDDDWAEKHVRDTNLQDWIDDEQLRMANVGFNLQMGWMDIDIDADDPEFNECMVAALDYNGVDTRFRFGRRSVGYPTHVLVQLGEDEASNFEELSRFEPREFRIGGKRYHTQLRSYPTNIADKKNLYRSAKQTVMPGSVYLHKHEADRYDLSVWYKRGGIADNVHELAATTPRRAGFNQVVRAIAFATFVYVLREHWVEGSRQTTVNKVAGWLARVVADGEAINNHEVISADVFCPVDTDEIAESLLSFAADFFGDDEKHMRIRSYQDAREKLARNPDAKIPGWPAIEAMLGPQAVVALRTTFTPGSDVSVLTQMAERYLFDDTDANYIDRDRHKNGQGVFVHEPSSLERRHIDETVIINGKPRAAFRMFETSKMRVRVAGRNLYPDLGPGVVVRLNRQSEVIGDDDADTETSTIFNTWRGWPYSSPDPVDEVLLARVREYMDRLLGYMTQDNPHQIEWIKQWVAWTLQHPGDKQQIALVCVGGQGVGKSFFGNTVLEALFGYLWGTASASIIDNKFNVGPFIDKMIVFVDEVKFHNESGTEEVKRLIRNVDTPGMEKFAEGRNYKIYSRMYFASNRFDMSLGQSSVIDRALFYVKAYDHKFKGMTDIAFRSWADTLKPWFTEFAELLKTRAVREHLFHMFMTYPTDKQAVESIKYSSSLDPEIAGANMRPSRRIAKYILEDGRILEDMSIEHGFTIPQLGARIEEVANILHMRPVRTDMLLAEFEETGLLRRTGFAMHIGYKVETAIDIFAAATGLQMEKRWEFTDADRGENHDPKDRKPWKGKRPGVVQASKF